MKLRTKTLLIFILLSLTFAFVNLLAAPPKAALDHYHVSVKTLHALNATIVIPVIGIWYIGLLGYEKLRRYEQIVKENNEGKHVGQLTRGVMILAWWLPLSSTLSALLGLLSQHDPSFTSPVSIIVGYLSLLFPLFGFWYINRACRDFSSLAKLRPRGSGLDALMLITILAGVFYCYLVANVQGSIYTTYHMPMQVVMSTLVIPYIFSWYLGLLAVYDLHRYSQSIKGIIYRKAWNTLALGIAWIVIFSMLLQYFTAVSAKVGNLSLGWILVMIYALLPIMAVGYILIASGARRLAKIEEA